MTVSQQRSTAHAFYCLTAIQALRIGPYLLIGNFSLFLVAGALCGSFFAATITHPMDTIKTCMQGDMGREKYTTVTGTGNKLMAEYGVAKGLFKGLSFRIALIATTFFLVNNLKQQLLPIMYPHHVKKND